MDEKPDSSACVKCPNCSNEFKAMSESDIESFKRMSVSLSRLTELMEEAVAQVKKCQVHFAQTGEGSTQLYEEGRNVIVKYSRHLQK